MLSGYIKTGSKFPNVMRLHIIWLQSGNPLLQPIWCRMRNVSQCIQKRAIIVTCLPGSNVNTCWVTMKGKPMALSTRHEHRIILKYVRLKSQALRLTDYSFSKIRNSLCNNKQHRQNKKKKKKIEKNFNQKSRSFFVWKQNKFNSKQRAKENILVP